VQLCDSQWLAVQVSVAGICKAAAGLYSIQFTTQLYSYLQVVVVVLAALWMWASSDYFKHMPCQCSAVLWCASWPPGSCSQLPRCSHIGLQHASEVSIVNMFAHLTRTVFL
jgi:hypothetical protein